MCSLRWDCKVRCVARDLLLEAAAHCATAPAQADHLGNMTRWLQFQLLPWVLKASGHGLPQSLPGKVHPLCSRRPHAHTKAGSAHLDRCLQRMYGGLSPAAEQIMSKRAGACCWACLPVLQAPEHTIMHSGLADGTLKAKWALMRRRCTVTQAALTWMPKLVAHEVQPGISSQCQGQQPDHLVQSHASLYGRGGRLECGHVSVHCRPHEPPGCTSGPAFSWLCVQILANAGDAVQWRQLS